VSHSVEALSYKPVGCGFDSRCCPWNCLLTKSFRAHYGPGVDAPRNRNEYQEYFLGGDKGGRCVGLANLSSSSAECNDISEPETHGTLRFCQGCFLPLPLMSPEDNHALKFLSRNA